MAGGADHEGLASPGSHELRPRRLWLSRLCEVGKLAYVMNHDVCPPLT